jgi:mRNA-degrading endonuclease toxin of MazEF toxin-antitoxin module
LQQVNWRSIIVLPLSTASAPARRSPTVVALPAGTAGLVADSVVVCHQITTLDRGKLETYIGELPEALMPDVEAAVKAATGMV